MIVKLYEDNPNPREILEIVKILKDGGVIVYPTDTLYAFGCDITNAKAVEKICAIKNIDPVKMPLSFVCSNISHVSNYSFIDNKLFKILKSCLPGPFTFLLKGNSNLPKLFKKKNVVGIRIPDNKIALAIVEALGNPILSSSVPINEDEIEYSTDPELIEEFYGSRVDCVIDAGIGETEPSTIIDCTGDEIEVKRKGKGIFIPE
ncbi:MAG: L-threonylcarbamoyladenylate synthase [Paludibacteraceae bacterium]|nr:L-threonylcarbamoyladenylate synthase [Paludibacteraceae bacterium]